jgi:O-6-methylguanine DNA methyltransferase
MNSVTLQIDTVHGPFLASYSNAGLRSLSFPSVQTSRKGGSAEPDAQLLRWHRQTTQALQRVLAGKTPSKLPPLDLADGTDFQRSVWRALQDIPSGRTVSYAQVARAVGRPKALRAVGGACGANPIPVLIPCHRVLAQNRKIGGFSGGLDWKIRLLEAEGVQWGAQVTR